MLIMIGYFGAAGLYEFIFYAKIVFKFWHPAEYGNQRKRFLSESSV